MKRVKKLTAFLILIAFALTFIAPVTAMAAATGSIKITNATVDKEYTIYKLFDATVDANGGGISYTLPSDKTLADDNTWFTVDTAGNVQAKSGADVSTEAFKTWATSFGTQVSTAKATGDTVSFTGLSYGYYYITSSLGSVITVTSTNPNAEVIDKNQQPSWEKVITNTDVADSKGKTSTASYGDEVAYCISINATQYVGDKAVKNYAISDTLDSGLTYVADSLKISVGGTDVTSSLTKTGFFNGATSQSGGITIPWDAATYGSNAVIKVEYKATLNTNAVIAGDGNKNTATYSYTLDDNQNTTVTSQSEATTTYTYALGIHKIDGTTKASLSGAKFSIDGVSATQTTTSGVYQYTTDSSGTKQFATDSNGVLIIKGLKAGKYTVTEEVAPDGYNKLTKSVEIEAGINSATTKTETNTICDADGKATTTTETITYAVPVVALEVENNAGTELPSTGGIGTTIFYVLGSAFVVGAGVLLVTRKRMILEK